MNKPIVPGKVYTVQDGAGNKKTEVLIPSTAEAYCEECFWAGVLNDCKTEMASEGWEYPEYTLPICPLCGAEATIS